MAGIDKTLASVGGVVVSELQDGGGAHSLGECRSARPASGPLTGASASDPFPQGPAPAARGRCRAYGAARCAWRPPPPPGRSLAGNGVAILNRRWLLPRRDQRPAERRPGRVAGGGQHPDQCRGARVPAHAADGEASRRRGGSLRCGELASQQHPQARGCSLTPSASPPAAVEGRAQAVHAVAAASGGPGGAGGRPCAAAPPRPAGSGRAAGR
jgi:hypothetical protein